MTIGEVCLLTLDVPRLSVFYGQLLGLRCEGDETHVTLIAQETMLTVLRSDEPISGQNVALAFTVQDIHAFCRHARSIGARIVQEPTRQPWGAINMCLLDPDGRKVYFRERTEDHAAQQSEI